MSTLQPRPQTATSRRLLRSKIRNSLGPSSAAAPEIVDVLRSLDAMVTLVDYASNGHYRVELVGPAGHQSVSSALSQERSR